MQESSISCNINEEREEKVYYNYSYGNNAIKYNLTFMMK